MQAENSLKVYIQLLKSSGIFINSKLYYSHFKLKNGLTYSGLATSQTIHGDEQLVKVPIQLLLSCSHALKQSRLHLVFTNTFYRQGNSWQSRVLVTYLLFILAKGEKTLWWHMISNFSKQIEILAFWEEKDYQCLIDKSVCKAAFNQRKCFQEQWNRFQQLQKEYTILNESTVYSKQNYQWLYTHVSSRCFGSFLNCLYFVPFCQFFNHNAADVSFKCISNISQNILNAKKQKKQQKTLEISFFQRQICDQQQMSSGESQDYTSDDDTDYSNINTYKIRWLSKISSELKQTQVFNIDQIIADIYQRIEESLQWKGFTLIFLGQLIEAIKIAQNEFKSGRIKYPQTRRQIEQLRLIMAAYLQQITLFYKNQGKIYSKMIKLQTPTYASTRNRSWLNYQQYQQQNISSYYIFSMQAHSCAYFKPGQQVYFCYGKLSNRSLLTNYGFCLQNNPYEHVWIKICLRNQISPYPDLLERIQVKNLSVNLKIKLKKHTMALQPIVLMRMKRWRLKHQGMQNIFCVTNIQKELEDLSKVKLIYSQFFKQYQTINEDLADPTISYHQYFARLYNIQKKKIIEFQIHLLDQATKLLKNIAQNQKYQKNIIKTQLRPALKNYMQGLRGLKNFNINSLKQEYAQ